MRLTIALDPGLRASGLAVFEGAVPSTPRLSVLRSITGKRSRLS